MTRTRRALTVLSAVALLAAGGAAGADAATTPPAAPASSSAAGGWTAVVFDDDGDRGAARCEELRDAAGATACVVLPARAFDPVTDDYATGPAAGPVVDGHPTYPDGASATVPDPRWR